MSRNERRVSLIEELITQQMNHWFLFSGVLTALEIVSGYSSYPAGSALLWALCSLYQPLYLILRVKIKRFFPMLLLHVIAAPPVPAALWFLHRETSAFLFGLCAVCYGAYSVVLRIGSQNNVKTSPLHPLAGAAITAFSLTFLHYQGITDRDFIYILPLIFALSLYALTLYIRQYKRFITVNESSAGYIPAAEMFRSGFGLTAVFAAAGAVLLTAAANLGNYANLWRMIKGRIRDFIRRIFSGASSPKAQTPPMGEAQMQPVDPSAQTGLYSNTTEIWKILERAALIITACALIFCAAVALVKLVLFLRLRFLAIRRAASCERAEGEPQPDLREKCDVEKISVKKEPWSSRLSCAQRIRRLYKKRILSSVGELAGGSRERLKSMTAGECGRRLDEQPMAGIYAETRYSQREADADDVRRMKKALSLKRSMDKT